MRVRWPVWSAYQTLAVVTAGLAAGFVAGSFLMLMSKRLARPVREALCVDLPDPQWPGECQTV